MEVIMKFTDINKRFTEIVSEYMNNGYIFNAASMNGSQGEIAKIDLTNGDEIIRIYVDRFSDWKESPCYEGVEIVVGRNTDMVAPNSSDAFCTIWNNCLSVLARERFYKVGDNRNNGPLYGDKCEACSAAEKRINRYTAKQCNYREFAPTPQMIEIAKHIVREKLGYKRVVGADIKLKKNCGKYTVYYHGEHYELR